MHKAPFELTAELQEAVRGFFERIPFNQSLGIQIGELAVDKVSMHLPMKPELIGNFVQGILHGGVISALLDVTGGAMALIGAFERHHHLSAAERMAKLSKLGTIDLRTDYLHQGIGKKFTATGRITRLGGRIASVQMTLENETGLLIATGGASYVIS